MSCRFWPLRSLLFLKTPLEICVFWRLVGSAISEALFKGSCGNSLVNLRASRALRHCRRHEDLGRDHSHFRAQQLPMLWSHMGSPQIKGPLGGSCDEDKSVLGSIWGLSISRTLKQECGYRILHPIHTST